VHLDGHPAADATVRLVARSTGAQGGGIRTDRDGRYELLDADPGEYLVWITCPGAAEDWRQRVSFPVDEEVPDLQHELEQEARLELHVVDDQGQPVGSARARLVVHGRPSELPELSALTDPLGRLTMTRLAPGRGELYVDAKGHPVAGPIPAYLERGATRSLEVELIRLGSIDVSIVDARGRPAPGSLVELRPAMAGPIQAVSLISSDSGGCHFSDLAPGAYELSAGGSTPIAVEVAPGEARSVTVTLSE
jgi:hypothetical protein